MPTSLDRRAVWQQRLTDQQDSGLSITAWCWQQNVSEQSFYYWRRRLVAAPAAPTPDAPQWVAVLPEAGAGLTLRVGAVAVEVGAGFDPRVLAAVLAVLEGR